MYKLHFFSTFAALNKDEYLLINILRDIMQKKTYMKPLVSLYAIEALTIFAGSTDKPGTPPSVPSPGFQVEGGVTSGDDEDVWE